MNAQRQLLALLNESFSTTELRALLIALGVDPDSLAAPDTPRNKLAQEMILHFQRRKRLTDLADEMHRQRPDLAEELAPFLSEPISPVTAAMRTPVAPTPVPSGTGQMAVDTRPWAKPLLLGAGILALVILGLLVFQTFYIPPPNIEADTIIVVRVFDAETTAPLERAQVTFAVGGSAPRVAYSDTQGVAVIQRLGAQGGGRLTVQLEGYAVYERNLPSDNLNTAVDIPLKRSD